MIERTPLLNAFDMEYLLDMSPDLVCVAGYDGYFKRINPAVIKSLGYTNEELLSKPINTFIHPDDRELTTLKRERIKSGVPLLNFENRYITKDGAIVWLAWTSMPIEEKKVVFAIAKDVTLKKIQEVYQKNVMADLNNQRVLPPPIAPYTAKRAKGINIINPLATIEAQLSFADKAWLANLEKAIRKNVGKNNMSISLLSDELAISERQLHRRVKTILGLTPNTYIRIIRLKIAHEAIETGKYRTISEVSYAAGFETPTYFRKLFSEIYGYEVSELL